MSLMVCRVLPIQQLWQWYEDPFPVFVEDFAFERNFKINEIESTIFKGTIVQPENFKMFIDHGKVEDLEGSKVLWVCLVGVKIQRSDFGFAENENGMIWNSEIRRIAK